MDQPKRSYRPLIVLILIAVMAGFAIAPHAWMPNFMGVFLCIFAMLKLFSPGKFADGFQMYDILARPFRPYAFVYPYIELALGLAWLSGLDQRMTAIATIVVFAIGTIGVLAALRRGLNINCPCMGNVLNVPLSTVTLTEDIAMIAMAAYMLFQEMS